VAHNLCLVVAKAENGGSIPSGERTHEREGGQLYKFPTLLGPQEERHNPFSRRSLLWANPVLAGWLRGYRFPVNCYDALAP
jgi:hypothetical protein